MSAGHTPGPWRIDIETNDYEVAIVGRPHWKATRYGVRGEWDVARMEIIDEHPEETASNARLIAAAPELLEALQYVRANLGDPVPIGRRRVQRVVDAAIAKARGEA